VDKVHNRSDNTTEKLPIHNHKRKTESIRPQSYIFVQKNKTKHQQCLLASSFLCLHYTWHAC